ncbi:hypothetical protein HKBW3S03_00854 [Candidatus Hakubella thermalkaliphila]|uniref:Uncharacterized protein n=1 Tax=Candidatus Hakubella thermalkaliphila TaxID=2754717 RepID=A0A6V8NGC0_9ACTN|nr:hypothetical protein [Candidatus Hakubella thermalkaliphila]GFP19349.1 hypothetical protein HKBW3S03_00854 [Candidatus Hakubella thermalkaliphila]GFP21373.1 hypothetical protein HKBW3S06_00599 [Candidatus Hakubella thermalkaliphila]GFP30835.1 hypothetical protein HKBW3S34_01754 [Candidatus Hakubella thermalkaliphila]GFP37645.1 hypothetical protein HKBW3S44_01322 [Candidatus Hakubella thermalkaliphila]GFP41969.1 hypothetical protein HKBW3C_01096 [Candidatus Hakubella thermalkaliphila]
MHPGGENRSQVDESGYFLPIYQPLTQTKEILDQVTSESYARLVAILEQFPTAKITLNINACLTETISETSREDSGYERARALTDAGLHCCQYWWASCRPSWSTDMIETGARQLRDAILALNVSHQSVKEEAQELYHEIMSTVWEWQRSGKARRKAQAYLRPHSQEKKEEARE